MREQYTALVVDNNDPEKRGRIKVSCGSLCGVDPDSNQPREYPDWIEPEFAVMLTEDGAVATSGLFVIPNVGVKVVISLNDSSANDRVPSESSILSPDPRWQACLLKSGDELSSDFTTNYPYRMGLRSATGHVLLMDDTESESDHKVLLANGGKALDGSGCYVSLGGDGSITIGTPNGNLVFIDDPNKAITILDSNSNMISMQAGNITIAEGSKGSIINLSSSGVMITTPESISVTANDATINAQSINLGDGATESLIKGNTFQTIFNTHTHGTGVGPSTQPVVQLTGLELSLISKTK